MSWGTWYLLTLIFLQLFFHVTWLNHWGCHRCSQNNCTTSLCWRATAKRNMVRAVRHRDNNCSSHRNESKSASQFQSTEITNKHLAQDHKTNGRALRHTMRTLESKSTKVNRKAAVEVEQNHLGWEQQWDCSLWLRRVPEKSFVLDQQNHQKIKQQIFSLCYARHYWLHFPTTIMLTDFIEVLREKGGQALWISVLL